MTRTDVHRPSALIPADYEFVAPEVIKIEGLSDVAILSHARKVIAAHMERTGGTYSRHAHGGNCHVCGSVNMIYSLLYWHHPSNTYIRMGQDCAESVEMAFDRDALGALRKQVRDARERKAGKAKAKAMLDDAGLSDAWAKYEARNKTHGEWKAEADAWRKAEQAAFDKHQDPAAPHHAPFPKRPEFPRGTGTLCDVINTVIRYGNLSDKQAAFIKRLLDQIDDATRIDTERAAEKKVDAPDGKRVVVEGTVVSIKTQDSGFGPREVMTVKVETDDGVWLTWGTQPRALYSAKVGDAVRFVATIKRSDTDRSFSFFKRPTKATVVATVA